MGSDCLILDERFAAEVGVDLDSEDVRRVEGVDETGNPYFRSFARVGGSIHPTAAPACAMSNPDVMFQRIIHDGLIGDAFLRNFVVTWDIAASQIVLAPHGPAEHQ